MQVDKLKTIIEAAGLGDQVEPYWYSLFAKCIEANGIERMITTIGGGGVGGGGDAGGSDGGEAKEEEEEEEEEVEVDMSGGDMFGDGDDY